MNTICLNCQTEFKAQRSTAKFCSDKCRVQASRKQKEPDAYFDVRSAIYKIEKLPHQQEAIAILQNLRTAIDDALRRLSQQ